MFDSTIDVRPLSRFFLSLFICYANIAEVGFFIGYFCCDLRDADYSLYIYLLSEFMIPA